MTDRRLDKEQTRAAALLHSAAGSRRAEHHAEHHPLYSSAQASCQLSRAAAAGKWQLEDCITAACAKARHDIAHGAVKAEAGMDELILRATEQRIDAWPLVAAGD